MASRSIFQNGAPIFQHRLVHALHHAARNSEPEAIMSASRQERILLVDDNQMFRETLGRRLRAAGYQVVTEETGERAFLSVRRREQPIGWLYTRSALPRLIDGWILADAYHEVHAHRPVVISAAEARRSARDIILKQPNLAAVMRALLHAMAGERVLPTAGDPDAAEARHAA
jgi:CheY-like chemotaxis protein